MPKNPWAAAGAAAVGSRGDLPSSGPTTLTCPEQGSVGSATPQLQWDFVSVHVVCSSLCRARANCCAELSRLVGTTVVVGDLGLALTWHASCLQPHACPRAID